jgi:aminoglycoside adenylyltransferase-like protein/nucleotidyltransferase-like protein
VATTYASNPTPYEDVNAILRLLFTKQLEVLGSQLVGLYLYGSLSLGDFDPASSDIDFLTVTAEELPAETIEALRVMHEEIARSGLLYADHLEGSYIPRAALRRYDPEHARHPSIGVDWEFHIGEHGDNWIIERQIVREHGVVIYGPAPQTLIDPVSPQELRTAVCRHLETRWQEMLTGDLEWLRPRNYQAFAILSMCRALYTLQHNTTISKPQAAAWAQERYPQWRPIIERALVWRPQTENDDLTETVTFVHEALAQALALCGDEDDGVLSSGGVL